MKGPIDSRQLRAFAALARTGSFTLAAKELFLSQSAVSHSMKALEEDVGCRLLDRVGKKVLLTQAGETLLHHARKILDEMDAARGSLRQLGKWGQGRIRVGASPAICQHILPGVLGEFRREYPQTSIVVEPGDVLESMDRLRRNRIDLAIVLEPLAEDQFTFLPLFSDEMLFIVSPSHPWAHRGQVVQDEIKRQSFLLYSKSSYTFRMIDRFFREQDVVLNGIMELGSMEAIKELVKLGLGVSVLAPWVARKELREGLLVALPTGRRKLRRNWGILHWRARRLTLAEERFIVLCRTATGKLERDPESPSTPPEAPNREEESVSPVGVP